MAETDISICNQALAGLGANAISSFEDGTDVAAASGAIYATTRDAMLAEHPWNFALAQQALPALAATPDADYDAAYQLPSDCLRVWSAGAYGYGRGLAYRILGRTLQANTDVPVVLTYIARVDESAFPAFFTRALVARLKAELAIPLGRQVDALRGLIVDADRLLRDAKRTDAQEDTPPAIDDFPLIDCRY
jgi:hypothetical protein